MMMGMADVPSHHQVIIDRLCEPMGTTARRRTFGLKGRPGKRRPRWVVSVGGRGGQGADPASIRFLKERALDDQVVVTVSCTDGEGKPRVGTFSLSRGPDGAWGIAGGDSAGGGGGGIIRGRPWVNAAAGGRPFYVSGAVVEGPTVARVRLTFEGGLVLEDTPDANGIVLYPTGQDQPAGWQHKESIAELFDSTGKLVARHRLFGPYEPLP